MLVLNVGETEVFNDETQEFEIGGGTPIEIEHSLVSLSKWESEFEKPFLVKTAKSDTEIYSYIRHMCLTPNLPPELFKTLTEVNLTSVNQYLAAKMSATWFTEAVGPNTGSRETVTAEIIYYWMIELKIPFECQYWHLNRLLTLIKVCNQKNQPPKKMSRSEIAHRQRTLNAQRKAQMGTRG